MEDPLQSMYIEIYWKGIFCSPGERLRCWHLESTLHCTEDTRLHLKYFVLGTKLLSLKVMPCIDVQYCSFALAWFFLLIILWHPREVPWKEAKKLWPRSISKTFVCYCFTFLHPKLNLLGYIFSHWKKGVVLHPVMDFPTYQNDWAARQPKIPFQRRKKDDNDSAYQALIARGRNFFGTGKK